MRGRENSYMALFIFNLAGQHINLRDPLDLIPKKFHTNRPVCGIGRKNFKHISLHPEGTSMKIHFIPCILNVDQLPYDLIPVFFHSRTQRDHHIKELLGSAQTINAGYRRNHNYIPSLT